jgi:hypothetical protein
MKCEHFLGMMLDAAASLEHRAIELDAHLRSCHSCSVKFHDLSKTMDLLDEWKCPEPSPGFDSQLRARLAEGSTSPGTTGWSFLARQVLAGGLATLAFIGILTVRYTTRSLKPATQQSESQIVPGSAVGDLQTLEEVDNVSGDSDLLDQLAPETAGRWQPKLKSHSHYDQRVDKAGVISKIQS